MTSTVNQTTPSDQDTDNRSDNDKQPATDNTTKKRFDINDIKTSRLASLVNTDLPDKFVN